MLEQKVTIVPVTLHTKTENPITPNAAVHSSNSTCAIKMANAEISFSNSVDEHIIQTIIRELKNQ